MKRRVRLSVFTMGAVLLLGSSLFVSVARSGPKSDPGQLRTDRLTAAAQAFALQQGAYQSGQSPLDGVYLWSVRWYQAQGEIAAQRATAAAAHLARMRALMATVKTRHEAGAASGADLAGARYYLVEAELWATGRK